MLLLIRIDRARRQEILLIRKKLTFKTMKKFQVNMVFYVYATLQSCVSSQILLYMHEIVLQAFLVLYI